MVRRCVAEFGAVHILVNNAGTNYRGPITEIEPALFNDVMNTNVLGPWLCSRAVLPHMRAQKWGRIVNISSVLGVVGLPRRTPYCASKGALCQVRAHYFVSLFLVLFFCFLSSHASPLS